MRRLMDRLTAADLSMMWPEDFGWPQDIGAIASLDGSSLLDSNGRFRIEVVREQIGLRVHLLPRFRQVLYMPRGGLGWPLWVMPLRSTWQTTSGSSPSKRLPMSRSS
jgi:diacylglycerol O-acyltransferase / wax synthase